jgi:cation:H+ antiporter
MALPILMIVLGLIILVWSTDIFLGVSDLMIGLTVVAIGALLAEPASCVAAARKGEHDPAVGNVLGSNLFNTLAVVVGLAGAIHSISIPAEIITRDWPLMTLLTIALFAMNYSRNNSHGKINRLEGGVLPTVYIDYALYLINPLVSA